jgi:hypothetical protein
LAALLSFLIVNSLEAAVAVRRVDASRAGRTVDGRVARLDSRLAPAGYPITDVTLEPSGERFTILGGYRDGVLWVCEEEERFTAGESIRVQLEDGPNGPRPAAVWREASAASASETAAPLGATHPLDGVTGVAPRVLAITPASGPAAADADLEVEVLGTGFGGLGQGAVFFQGLFVLVQASVLEWSDTRIRCLVPRPGLWNDPQVLGGPVKVWTPAGGWSDGDPFLGGAEYHVLFQFAGDRFRDARVPIGYSVNSRDWPWSMERAQAMLATAAGAWNAVPFGYGRLAPGGETDHAPGPKKDGVNVIGWTVPWPHSPNWLAVTWSGIDSLTGERREADVEINGERPWSIESETPYGEYDLQTTMTHEFGHWLRLGHIQELHHVMLPFQNVAEQRRSLGSGEVQGASWIYPTYGEVLVSADSAWFGGDRPDSLHIDVRLADRRGRTLAGVPAEEIRAFVEWTDSPAGELGSLNVSSAPGASLVADAATDEEGRTSFLITRAQGSSRIRLTVRGPLGPLRDRPVVYVSDAERGRPRAPLVLSAAWPNPARSGTVRATARLGAPAERLLARILDARGRVAAVLWDGPASGDVLLTWTLAQGKRPAAGLYFLHVESVSHAETRKLVVIAP